MLFDGIHKEITGSYFGNRLGPWASLTSAAGISPETMAFMFIVLGALWLAGALGLILRLRSARLMLIFVGVLSLFYLPLGTALSIVALVLLFRPLS